MLVLHSLAFGMYMLSIVYFYIIYTIYEFEFKSEQVAYLFYIALMINVFISFVA